MSPKTEMSRRGLCCRVKSQKHPKSTSIFMVAGGFLKIRARRLRPSILNTIFEKSTVRLVTPLSPCPLDYFPQSKE